MRRLVVEVREDEGEDAESFQVLLDALAQVGWDGELRIARRRRGAEAADIVLRLFELVEGHVLDAAVGAVVGGVAARLRSGRKDRATVEVLGPDGRVLRRVDVAAREQTEPTIDDPGPRDAR